MTTHLHPALRSRMNGVVPLITRNAFVVWTGIYSKYTFLNSTFHNLFNLIFCDQWPTQEFCWVVGRQQIQLRTEDRENGDMGAVAP